MSNISKMGSFKLKPNCASDSSPLRNEGGGPLVVNLSESIPFPSSFFRSWMCFNISCSNSCWNSSGSVLLSVFFLYSCKLIHNDILGKFLLFLQLRMTYLNLLKLISYYKKIANLNER